MAQIPNPGIGGLVQPQSGAVSQGLPPATPEEHQALTDRWHQFFTNPAVSAGLFQLGSSLLANTGSNLPFTARAGLALNDATRAVGGAAKFQADQQTKERELGQGDTRLAQGQTALDQSAEANKNTAAYQTGSLANDAARTAQQGETSKAELGLKKTELMSNDNYRKMTLELQHEQLLATTAGTQTPRERMLIAALKNIDDASALMGKDYDADAAAAQQLHIIDTLTGGAGASAVGGGVPGAAPTVPAGGPAPAPAPAPATGGPTPDKPLEGALPYAQAVPILKGAPTPENKAHFDAVYGPGAADAALRSK